MGAAAVQAPGAGCSAVRAGVVATTVRTAWGASARRLRVSVSTTADALERATTTCTDRASLLKQGHLSWRCVARELEENTASGAGAREEGSGALNVVFEDLLIKSSVNPMKDAGTSPPCWRSWR
ncbi:hypothetical protein MTO96_044672 [Rhipicephalus appendiculatus]